MSSIDSSMKNTPPLKELWEKSLGKMHLLGQMIGAESIRRGLASEDDLLRREAEAYHKLLHGERAGEPSEVDQMGDIILGDRVENHTVPTPAPPASSGKLLPNLAMAGVAALGLSTPLGVGAYLIADAMKSQPAPIVQPIAEPEEKPKPPVIITEPGKTFDYRVGEPIIE